MARTLGRNRRFAKRDQGLRLSRIIGAAAGPCKRMVDRRIGGGQRLLAQRAWLAGSGAICAMLSGAGRNRVGAFWVISAELN